MPTCHKAGSTTDFLTPDVTPCIYVAACMPCPRLPSLPAFYRHTHLSQVTHYAHTPCPPPQKLSAHCATFSTHAQQPGCVAPGLHLIAPSPPGTGRTDTDMSMCAFITTTTPFLTSQPFSSPSQIAVLLTFGMLGGFNSLGGILWFYSGRHFLPHTGSGSAMPPALWFLSWFLLRVVPDGACPSHLSLFLPALPPEPGQAAGGTGMAGPLSLALCLLLALPLGSWLPAAFAFTSLTTRRALRFAPLPA